ncbi:cytochrome P450 [Penicillium angulare]|uniref:cytochrome P450 n=1 Tax=Penicillium angulare TaxID=116970 RepID=UPI00253F91DF|nr:cytochrome P450 [Penicillium angulare]KAJ5291813.1 cytochrome P450 [Penicillium angulare]
MHAQRRKLLSRPFSKSVIRNTWEPVVREKARLAVSQIQNELTTAGVSDVLKWSTFLATDVISVLMFGASFDMLQKGEKNDYIRTLETTLKGSGIMAEIPILKTIIPLIPLRCVREIFGIDSTIAEHSKQLLTRGKEDPGSHRNIFYGLINEAEKYETSLTETEVAYEAKNLVVAGSDTTAVTLTYFIWAVLSRPELHSKIKAELSTLDGDWAESQLEELPLLNATLTETLRLYGAAPGGLPRTVPKEGATLSGYHIPGGMVVSTQCWTAHRDPTLFPDPEKFDPSRWLPGRNEASEKARSAMSPFGSGSRICLGIHLAWMELRLATAEFILRCGDVKLAPSVTEESMKPQHFFLIAPVAHKCEIMRA